MNNSFYFDPIYLLPFIAAFIGWLTNYVAVKMLFKPKKPVNLLLFKLQGVFPKRQAAFAEKMGHIVATELFSANDVKLALQRGAESGAFSEVIKKEIKRMVSEKLPQAFPILQAMMTPELIDKITSIFESEVGVMIGALGESMGSDLDQALNVKEIVSEKVNNFSSDKLEEMLFAIMKKEFKFIEFVGAVLGFLIGVAQIALIKWEIIVNLLSG
jgi:uncharacterized membrane protein YheB (UPF0754 family)